VSLYVDASCLLKRYLKEPDSAQAERVLMSDAQWVTGRHTAIEVLRNLARDLDAASASAAASLFQRDWQLMLIVELDERTCELAAMYAETTGVRTLDALHLGAAQRFGDGEAAFATCDLRQARAARSLGWSVFGPSGSG
jgi:predicted nucleic acid-binding protein